MTDILAQARALVGKPATAPAVSRDPVNLPMIRRWCEAMGETNPIHTDDAAARAAGHPGIVAPPAMLEVWTMTPYRATGRSKDETMEVVDMFDRAGYPGVVATNIEQEYDRYLTLGDTVKYTTIIDDVSDEKRTGLGIGHFITIRYEFTDQNDAPLGRMLFRVLKFKPNLKTEMAPAKPAAEKPEFPHPMPAITHDNFFFWEGVQNRRLLIQKCSGCGLLRHPPGPACPHCHSLEWEAVEASGKGTIYSYVIMYQPRLPAFTYPLPIVTVELAEGTRIVANLLDVAPEDVQIGAAVTLDFQEIEPGYPLPAFRLSKEH